MKLKVYAWQNPINILIRLHTEWENIFSFYTSVTGLISIIYKELQKINKELKLPIIKWANDMIR